MCSGKKNKIKILNNNVPILIYIKSTVLNWVHFLHINSPIKTFSIQFIIYIHKLKNIKKYIYIYNKKSKVIYILYFGGQSGGRTPDLLIKSQLLYQLS